jgi:diguanylate cyclase (GGDEF)-like protein/PAS domain S-box-containing protein
MLTIDPLYASFIVSLVLAASISLILSGYIWQRRTAPGATPLLGALAAVFFWAAGYIFEYTSSDLSIKLFSFNISYIGSVSLHLTMLLFSLQYCGLGKWITRKRVLLLAIIPVITLLLQWTKQYHGLMYYDISLSPDGPFLLVLKHYGHWFWIDWSYNYLLLAATIIILIRRVLQRPHLYARQIVYIIMIIVIPITANLLYMMRFIPVPHADWTPASLSLSTIFMALMVFNKQLLDVIPIARESLIETMNEGFIVTDCKGFVVDFNSSAQKIIAEKETLTIGNQLPPSLTSQLDFDYSSVINTTVELMIHRKESHDYYIANVSPVYTRKHKHVGHLFIFHDITERKQTENLIKKLAYFDQLTTLPNRYLFYDRATMAIEHATRYNKKLAIVMLDLDKFKDVNDSFGHDAGDKVLQEVATRLISAIRKMDTVSRFGGDEFIFLLTEINDDTIIANIIGRIAHNLTRNYGYKGNSITIPFSIGVATYPDNSSNLDELIRNADLAMYQAKRLGHNRCQYYSPGMS